MINTKRPSYGPHPPQNASLLLEKTKANIRRSTPDSEALASSDDDQEQFQRTMNTQVNQMAKPTRRPSWLSDTYATTQRKTSSGSLDTLASLSAHQMTSSVDASSNWPGGRPSSRGHTAGSSSLPWNNTIWGSENSKILPARFSEVLPSPTSIGGSSSAIDSTLAASSPRRDSTSDAAIPFPIPLHPTLKTYRSQSYSAGQMEQEANAAPGSMRPGQYAYNNRTRAGSSFAGMHHRPGRPSVFGEFSGENLGQLQEVEDDEESAGSSDGGVRFANSQARKIEQLSIENAVLRQQAMANHAASFSGPFGMSGNPIPRTNTRGFQLSESVLEEPDDQSLGDDDPRSSNHSSLSGLGQHRYNGSTEGLRNASPEYFGNAGVGSKSPAGFRRPQWQSSVGFGAFGDGSQSRRHSFADVPRRTPSGNPHGDANNGAGDPSRARAAFGDPTTPQAEGSPFMANTPTRPLDPSRASSSHGPFTNTMNPPTQHRMQHFGQQQPHLPQHLYLVTFKAARAEFYYVQEGTGLDVHEGDLVIVEADRGTDLGTVAHKNVEWSMARDLKEHYVQEHYNWLMMFSRQAGGAAAAAARPSSSSNNPGPTKSNLLPGFGAQGSSTEPSVSEIKPKMIKRLAQNHEIHMLREKEGNEAKAKRMCQQKVAEHHLNMEILDAEFQMDWKKLTFYYFADSYINFNSLVTDLFKIYKTRIWMSAINPASFVSRNPNLPPLTGASSNAFGSGREQFDRANFDYLAAGVHDPATNATWFPTPNGGWAGAGSLAFAQWWSPSALAAQANAQANSPASTQPIGFGRGQVPSSTSESQGMPQFTFPTTAQGGDANREQNAQQAVYERLSHLESLSLGNN